MYDLRGNITRSDLERLRCLERQIGVACAERFRFVGWNILTLTLID